MEKEDMSLDQLDSLKTDLENKLEKLRDELLEVEGEIQGRVMKNKTTEFKELFESHINQFCKFTRHYTDGDDKEFEVIILCKINEVSYDPGKDSCVVRTKPIASYNYNDFHNEINFWPTIESNSIYSSQFLSGRVGDIIFYESLDDAKMFLKNIIDEQVK